MGLPPDEEQTEKEDTYEETYQKAMGIAAAILVAVVLLGFWLYTEVIHPRIRLEEAKHMAEKGDYIGAYELLTELNENGLRDSQKEMEKIRTNYYLALMRERDVHNWVYFGEKAENNNGTIKKPISWRILAKEDNRILLIASNCYWTHYYHLSNDAVTWETSDIRAWLNQDLYERIFSEEEKGYILTTTLENKGNGEHLTQGGNQTEDKMFLLSAEEVSRYFEYESDMSAFGKDYTYQAPFGEVCWWLRTPGEEQNTAAYVRFNEGVWLPEARVHTYGIGVRPAIWVTLPE